MAEKRNPDPAATEPGVADAGSAAQAEVDQTVEAVRSVGSDATPRDRVLIPSLRVDGTPAQTDNFELIGDPDATRDAIVRQATERRVSAVDDAARTAIAQAPAAGETEQDPVIQALTDLHEQAAKAAEGDADKLIRSRNPRG